VAGRVRGVPQRSPQRVGGMLGAGGTCEFSSPTECRCPASTSDTGFCACLRPAARLCGGTGINDESALGGRARGCPCPRAGVADKRSHGWRSAVSIERAEPRMGAASVRRWAWAAPSGAASNGCDPQVENLRPLGDGHGQPRAGRHQTAATRRLKTCGHLAMGTGSPERGADTIPIAYAIGLPDGEIPQVENLRPRSAALRRRGGGSGGRPGARHADPTRS
jgi:hypothetical protein